MIVILPTGTHEVDPQATHTVQYYYRHYHTDDTMVHWVTVG